MRPDYKNWVPRGMVAALCCGSAAALAGLLAVILAGAGFSSTLRTVLLAVLGLAFLGLFAFALWAICAYRAFSYHGKRQLSRHIVEGTAKYVTLPPGGTGLDVGCGSGALTIACAKRNPQGRMVGIDRWGKEYASYNQPLCERNARAEGVHNALFQRGDAIHLDFPDGYFDAVTSNYVYHNIAGHDKQALLRETLRVLKKGGVFAIHDLMSPARYGDMQAFARTLRAQGYAWVELIDTTSGLFMTKGEAGRLMLGGSILLVGKK